MGPINYSVDVQSPFQAALQGYQVGAEIRTDLQKQQEALRQQQLAEQQQADLSALIRNPAAGARDYAAMTLKYPKLREQFKQSWETLSADQKQSELDLATRAYAAISSNRPDLAESILRDRATAMRNGGAPEEQVKAQETWADLIKTSPEQARHIGGLMLSSVMGDKFGETFGKLGSERRAEELQPGLVAKGTADAAKAGSEAVKSGIEAKYADQAALIDLEKKGWDIKKITADIDIAKQANRIAAMNAATAREGNALKREELGLKVQEARNALDTKIRDKVATAEAGATNIDNMLNTIERIKRNKSLNDVVGSIEGRLPVIFSDEAADASALIETLGSQAFLAQIPNIKGMGALSNAEGEKLQSALQNLSRTQSEKQFNANLDEASRLLKKGRETLSRSTGVPLGKPDTPAAPSSRPPLSSFEGR